MVGRESCRPLFTSAHFAALPDRMSAGLCVAYVERGRSCPAAEVCSVRVSADSMSRLARQIGPPRSSWFSGSDCRTEEGAADARTAACNFPLVLPAARSQAAIQRDTPQRLFQIGGLNFASQGAVLPPYMVSRDGQRFLIAIVPVQTNTSPINLLLNSRFP